MSRAKSQTILFSLLLLLLDIAQVSINHAWERYKQRRDMSMKASFLVFDAFNVTSPGLFFQHIVNLLLFVTFVFVLLRNLFRADFCH